MTPQFSLTPIFGSSVGFDRFNDLFEQLARSDASEAFPPYDIEKLGEDAYRITLAVAGFADSELQVTAKDDQLVVSGRRPAAVDDKVSYLHKGIAVREFRRTFRLADYMTVTDAELKDGLLRIDLVRELPEEMKPRKIDIRSGAVPAIGSAERQKRLS